MRRGIGGAVVGLSLLLVGGCSSGGVVIQPVPTPRPVDNVPVATPRTGQSAGSWTGTITMEGTIDVNKSTEGDNGQDPNSTYYDTYTKTRTNQTHVSDSYTLTADDPESLEYGISGVTFGGDADVTGSSDQNTVQIWDMGNSGCTWTETNHDEANGSWSESGEPEGSLEFEEDGSYRVFLRVSPSGAEYPSVDTHSWQEISDISANCEATDEPYDVTMEGSPPFGWVNELLGKKATDGSYVEIAGTVANGSTTVSGSKSWEVGAQFPELQPEDSEIDPINVTINWNFQHTGPITLPHD